jgi:probable phosphoglycerate mutase
MSDLGNGSWSGPRLVLVPAAETDFDKKGRLEGDVDVPLTERGRAMSRRILEETLKPLGGVDAVYTAANRSSRETAEILVEANHGRVRVLPELRAVSLGLWEGQLVSDVRCRHERMYVQWRRDAASITPPGGEELESAYLRATNAVKRIRKKHKEGTVAVVASPLMISLVCCRLEGEPVGRALDVADGLDRVRVFPQAEE